MLKKDLRKNGAKIDTISVLYTAYSAQNGKKEAEASKYYEKFADLKIGGADYKDAYTYILVHAANIKDADKFYKYITIAKEVYGADAVVFSQKALNQLKSIYNLGLDKLPICMAKKAGGRYPKYLFSLKSKRPDQYRKVPVSNQHRMFRATAAA